MSMKSLLKISSYGALCIMLVFTLALIGGCKGSNGAQGAQGIQGPQGPGGPQGPAGASASTFGTHNLLQGRVDATVSNIVVSNVGGAPKVSFNIATAAGPYAALTSGQVAVYLADLVPSGTVSAATHTSYSTDYFEQWASEAGDHTDHSGNFVPITPGATFDNSDAANGNYSWTFSAPFGTATAGSGLRNDDYNASHVQRLILKITGDTAINNTVGIEDFNVPAAGADATALTPQRAFVTIDTCKKCHSKYMDNAAHASSYLDTRACDICHSPLYGSSRHPVGFMDGDNAILPVFLHQIHASKYTTKTFVAQPISFPQDIRNCVVCHADPNNIGADKIDNWKTHPTARVCSSCHTGNTLGADGRSMLHDQSFVVSGPSSVPTNTVTDAACSGCHGSAGSAGDYQDIVTVHDTSPTGLLATGWDIPEYNVTISVPTPTNNSYFVSGETFTVDVTLAANPDFAGTATTIPAVYTDPTDTAYIAGNGLHVANLYIYGPRSHAVPLLGTQTLSLFGTGDSTGFHYPVTIPATAEPGTYMVRARIADYSYDRHNPTGGGAHPYQIESYALAYFQIGTAAVQDKIDGGPDAQGSVCFNCHGNTKMHADDHAAPFDTDHCTACHDLSGGYADPIANRVHAVHSANSVGDLKNIGVDPTSTSYRNWADVTFPSNIKRCVVCHSSGNTSYKNNLYEIPCYGCHADATGTPQSHMATMGGIVSGFTATTDFSSESCAVCHGPGRDFDISD